MLKKELKKFPSREKFVISFQFIGLVVLAPRTKIIKLLKDLFLKFIHQMWDLR